MSTQSIYHEYWWKGTKNQNGSAKKGYKCNERLQPELRILK
jgi:hypothetical protein